MTWGRTIRIAVVAAVVVAAIALPYVATSYYVVLATLILATAVLASSVNMLAGDGGLYSLGHAGIAGAAGYGLAWSARQGFELPVQLAITLGITLVAGVVYGLISMRTNGVFFLMVSLAAGMICFGLAYRWSSVTGGDNGLTGIRRPELISEYWQFYFFALLVFALVTLGLWRVSRSPFGLTLRGIRDSPTRMRSLGFNVSAYKFAAIVMSGLVAGIAGMLLVWQSEFISPSAAGFQASALALIMVVLGGAGRTFGPLIGAAVVVLIQQVLSTYFDRWPSVLGALFIVVVILAGRRFLRGWSSRRTRRRPIESAPTPNAPHPAAMETTGG